MEPRLAALDLLRRLRVERARESDTRGRWNGVDLQIQPRLGRPGSRPALHARVELPRASDLRCQLRRIGEGDLHPRAPSHVESTPRPTGDAELDGWLELRGDVETARILQWLGPTERRALRALDGASGLLVERSAVSALLPVDDEDAQEVLVAALREAALALDAARSRVAVAAEHTEVHPTFIELGSALGLVVSTCPLAVDGEVEGFHVLVHVPNWGPFEDGVVVVDVHRPGPRGESWRTRVTRDGIAWQAARASVRTLGRLVRRLNGERSALLERTFHRVRQVRLTTVDATEREIELPMGFTLASGAPGRIVAVTRVPRSARELEACARRLVAVLASTPPPPPDPDASPYR